MIIECESAPSRLIPNTGNRPPSIPQHPGAVMVGITQATPAPCCLVIRVVVDLCLPLAIWVAVYTCHKDMTNLFEQEVLTKHQAQNFNSAKTMDFKFLNILTPLLSYNLSFVSSNPCRMSMGAASRHSGGSQRCGQFHGRGSVQTQRCPPAKKQKLPLYWANMALGHMKLTMAQG